MKLRCRDARLSAFILRRRRGAGFVSSARISKNATTSHVRVFSGVQWLCAGNAFQMLQPDTMEAEKQKLNDTHLSRFAIVGAFICPTLINSLKRARE